MAEIPFWLISPRRFKKKKFNQKPYSYNAQKIHNIYCESIGRSRERLVLEIIDDVRELLQNNIEVDFRAEITVPFSQEDKEGKDIKIIFLSPEKMKDKTIFFQVKSSQFGAAIFRQKHQEIPIIVVGKNKNPERDRQRIARFVAGIIRQEINKI